MLYRTVALAFLVAVSAVPIHQHRAQPAKLAHSTRIAKLQAVDPTATRAACEACVDAEDDLITKLTSEEGFTQAEATAATNHATKAGEHDAAESTLATATLTVATHKAAVQAIVTGDQGDLGADSPAGILSSTTALSTAAQAWADSIDARASAQGVVDGAQSDRTAAKAAERDAEAALAAASGLVTSARGAADAACSSMRAGGYGYVAPTAAPAPIVTAAPLTMPPTTEAPWISLDAGPAAADTRTGMSCLTSAGNPARTGADCPFDERYCVRYADQCSMSEDKVQEYCGEWAECGGVYCAPAYPAANRCLARTAAAMAYFHPAGQGHPGAYKFIDPSP